MQPNMQITLHNIGIIKDSTVDINGLTVIVGHNNSGKTTVGKVLFSLLDSVSNLESKITADKKGHIIKTILEVKAQFNIFSIIYREKNLNYFKKFPALHFLLFYENITEDLQLFSEENLKELIDDLLDNLSNVDSNKFYDVLSTLSFLNSKDKKIAFAKYLIEQSINELKKLKKDLNLSNQYKKYTKKIIYNTLKTEFSGQIQTINLGNEKSYINLTIDDTPTFELELLGNEIINDSQYSGYSKYKNIFFVDDPFILDELNSEFQKANDYTEQIISANINRHPYKLKSIITQKSDESIFQEIVINENLEELFNDINDVIPGEFQITSQDGPLYVHGNKKIKVPNLATGAKIFLILKILLQKGLINENTMLILDEPEAHLHPAWQNKLAEVIALIVKNLGTNILLTTHSSNFMLAIDAYMRKHDITSKVNFYQTQRDDDKEMVTYKCCNDDLGQIYADYLKYLAEVKNLRDKYLICYEDEC